MIHRIRKFIDTLIHYGKTFSAWLSPRGVAIFFLISALIIGGWGFYREFYSNLDFVAYIRQPLNWLGKAIEVFYSNCSISLIQIALTVLIIDRLYDRLKMRDAKSRLIRDMGSFDKNIARNALETLSEPPDKNKRERSWLQDGSCVGAKLIKAQLAGLPLSEADLRGAELNGANLEGTILISANLGSHPIHGGTKLADACLRGAILNNASLQKAEMRRADLQNAQLDGANLAGANLQEAKLQQASLRGCNLSGVQMWHVDLTDADLTNAHIEDSQLRSRHEPIAARLRGAIMPNGERYNGRFNLKGDIELAAQEGVDTTSNEAMAAWYGISLEDYQGGQKYH
jgi:hypothetical protein